MTLWLTAVTPTRFPWATSSQIIRAPTYVFPEPGGPWMGSTDCSRARPSRRARATVSSPGRGSQARAARQPRRVTQEEVPPGPEGPGAVHAVLDDPAGHAEEGFFEWLGVDDREGEHRRRVDVRQGGPLLHVEGPLVAVEVLHLAELPIVEQIELVTLAELHFLGREAVAVHGRLPVGRQPLDELAGRPPHRAPQEAPPR